jgi:hypothetical protein
MGSKLVTSYTSPPLIALNSPEADNYGFKMTSHQFSLRDLTLLLSRSDSLLSMEMGKQDESLTSFELIASCIEKSGKERNHELLQAFM